MAEAKEDRDQPKSGGSQPSSPEGDKLTHAEMNKQFAAAQEHEARLTRAAQPVTALQIRRRDVGPTGLPLVWVHSNRRDNRYVLYNRAPEHPGGECKIGPFPSLVARTADVERVLSSGEAVIIPEPRRYELHPETREPLRDEHNRMIPNRKFPVETFVDETADNAAPPGRPIPLGREFDPDLFDEDALEKAGTLRRQQELPREVPAPIGAIVPGVTHPVA